MLEFLVFKITGDDEFLMAICSDKKKALSKCKHNGHVIVTRIKAKDYSKCEEDYEYLEIPTLKCSVVSLDVKKRIKRIPFTFRTDE